MTQRPTLHTVTLQEWDGLSAGATIGTVELSVDLEGLARFAARRAFHYPNRTSSFLNGLVKAKAHGVRRGR